MARQSSDQIKESRRVGRELSQAFADGAEPTPVQVRMALSPGEFCVAQIDVTVYQWLEGDGEYVHKSGGYAGGGVVGFVALRGAKAIGNSRRRAKAARASQATWREVDRGVLYMTNRRFAIQGRQWGDIWFSSIRMADTDSRSITLEIDGMPPTMFGLSHADYWFVLFQKVAYNQHYLPPPPDDEAIALPQSEAQPASDVYVVHDETENEDRNPTAASVSAMPKPLIGPWHPSDGGSDLLLLEPEGTYRLSRRDGNDEYGQAKVDGATLVLDSAQGVAKFQWLVDDSELVLIGRDSKILRYARADS